MKLKTLTPLLLIAALAALFSGCASSTNQAKQSGFLGDYSELRDGDKNEARYLYIDRRANFTKYTKVKIAPVTLWSSEDSNLNDVDTADLNALSDYLHTAIYNALKNDYEIVDENGPDVMLVRIALTEATGAKRGLNSVSTIIPVGLVLSTGKKLATGSHAFVGKASIEVELLDSSNGHRLGAAVDERAGAKGVEAEWTQVEKAFDFWAGKMRNRLERLTTASRLKQNLLDVKI
jgi:hypothetical protein